jgi:hypothetical protein
MGLNLPALGSLKCCSRFREQPNLEFRTSNNSTEFSTINNVLGGGMGLHTRRIVPNAPRIRRNLHGAGGHVIEITLGAKNMRVA